MARILKRPQAETDLDEIWLYIAQDSPDNADAFLDELAERCQALVRFPFLGTNRDELMFGLQSLAFGNYLIFYPPAVSGEREGETRRRGERGSET